MGKPKYTKEQINEMFELIDSHKYNLREVSERLDIPYGTVRWYNSKRDNVIDFPEEKVITQPDTSLDKILKKHNLSEKELTTIIKSSKSHIQDKGEELHISDKHYKYGYFSDAHIGHNMFKENLFDKMVKVFNQENVDFVINCGDTLEGMSGRPGHVFELTHIGFAEQFKYAKELLSLIKQPIYGIDGNHDQWYYKKGDMGIIVGSELENDIKNYNFLGQNEGVIIPSKSTSIMLNHPNDGSAYAQSYKLQKLIESLSGGEKPSIVHEGHYHKALYMFTRNVHGFESGTLSDQSAYMRGKKIAANVGFGVVDVFWDNKGIERLKHEFIPFYK
jgi:predicted phosphodiesterase